MWLIFLCSRCTGEFLLKQVKVCEAGGAQEEALSVGRVSSSFGWPALCSWTYFCTNIFTFHISAVPSSIYAGVLASVILWLLPRHQICPLDSGTFAGLAWYQQVFGRGWSTQGPRPHRTDAGGCCKAEGPIHLQVQCDRLAESLGYFLLSWLNSKQ